MYMSSNAFSQEYQEELNNPTGLYLNAANFEGQGLVVKLAEPVKRIKANDPKFGDKSGNTCEYRWETQDGNLMLLTSSSAVLTRELINNNVNIGDWCKIVSSKQIGKNGSEFTSWTIKKIILENEMLNTKSVFEKKQEELKEIDVNNIPF